MYIFVLMNYFFLLILALIAGNFCSWLWDEIMHLERFKKLKRNRFKISWYSKNKSKYHTEKSTI